MTVNIQPYSQEYFYSVALIVAAVVNFVLAAMLFFDSNNYMYDETPRYMRARRLTGTALAVFGLGFLLHWLFMPHFSDLLAGKALSFSYFHIGGVLFSMSHTGLIDRHYFSRSVVLRDAVVLVISLYVYWLNAWISDTTLTYLGSILFFAHVGFLTWNFYVRFYRIYKQLEAYADYLPNDTDKEVLWMHYSCHLIIVFGIGGMLCTVLFHDATLPFTILLFMGVMVFTYIFKALDNFGANAIEAERNMQGSEEFGNENENENENDNSSTGSEQDITERIEQWVAERHYADPQLTIKDAISQMGITDNALNYYLESHTTTRGYRQWITALRIEEAKRLMLHHHELNMRGIAKACGYADNSSLSRSFRAQEGMSPKEWYDRHNRENAPK